MKVVIVLVALVLLSGCTAPAAGPQGSQQKQIVSPSPVASPLPATPEQHDQAGGQVADQPAGAQAGTGEEGELFAGTVTPYRRFTLDSFTQARAQGKVIYLYFYANWCPICRANRLEILAAFDELALADAVGFEVHFNDNEVTPAEEQLAREYGVAYQHSDFVLARDGTVFKKTLTGLSKEEIIAALTEAVGA